MNPPAPGMPGTLFVVATPIGNLEDITLRAIRVLKEVQVVAAEDTRRTGLLLRQYGIRTPLVSLHEHNERTRSTELVPRLLAGESVALVSDAGTPVVSDPGVHLIAAAVAEGIAVEAVPGPSALTAALSVAGVPSERFTFVGFPPARAGERDRWLADLKETRGTLILFEAPHRVNATLGAIHTCFGNRFVVLARELTKLHETTTRGWLRDVVLAGVQERGEYVILVFDQERAAADRVSNVVEPWDISKLVSEFGLLTNNGSLSPRDAVASLAKTAGLSRQRVYRSLRSAGVIG